MANPASIPNPFETRRTGSPAASQPGPRSATGSARSARVLLDEQLAPLRIPALVLGALLICLGVAALLPLRGWLHDYGAELVIAAYLQYMAIATTLEVWGLRMTGKGPRRR
ncbi:hypothetical protein [Nocardia pseudovaccinii]|uniref:hypothetical protein n=1 Tax=Nocardia pseudovaccinii TaxID=189540 RepID=UPI000A91F611|nr:hypothetical protein [Nocardia pseudovaccinii]